MTAFIGIPPSGHLRGLGRRPKVCVWWISKRYACKISRVRWARLFSSTQYHRNPLKAITNLHNLFCRIYAKEYRLGKKTLPSTAGVLNPAAPVLHATVSGRLVLRRWQSRLASAAAMRGPDFPPPFWAIARSGLS